MVVNDAPPAAVVIWHELECGSYRADLGLWQGLAARRPRGAILDVGAGAGRVCLELARAGRELIALDRDEDLLAALRVRTQGLAVRAIHGDARELSLDQAEVGLCVVPMQTIQLLGGRDGRLAFLEHARPCMRPDGLIACAIATDFEPYDCSAGGPAPLPEWTLEDGMVYASRPLRLELTRAAIEIERERRAGAAAQLNALEEGTRGERAIAQVLWRELAARGSSARDLVVLDRISVADLHEEGRSAGLIPEPTLHLPPTAEHGASEVVVLRAG